MPLSMSRLLGIGEGFSILTLPLFIKGVPRRGGGSLNNDFWDSPFDTRFMGMGFAVSV